MSILETSEITGLKEVVVTGEEWVEGQGGGTKMTMIMTIMKTPEEGALRLQIIMKIGGRRLAGKSYFE